MPQPPGHPDLAAPDLTSSRAPSDVVLGVRYYSRSADAHALPPGGITRGSPAGATPAISHASDFRGAQEVRFSAETGVDGGSGKQSGSSKSRPSIADDAVLLRNCASELEADGVQRADVVGIVPNASGARECRPIAEASEGVGIGASAGNRRYLVFPGHLPNADPSRPRSLATSTVAEPPTLKPFLDSPHASALRSYTFVENGLLEIGFIGSGPDGFPQAAALDLASTLDAVASRSETSRSLAPGAHHGACLVSGPGSTAGPGLVESITRGATADGCPYGACGGLHGWPRAAHRRRSPRPPLELQLSSFRLVGWGVTPMQSRCLVTTLRLAAQHVAQRSSAP